MNPIINPVDKVDAAFLYIIGTSLLLLTLITIVMIWFVVKYRRSKNPVPADIRGNWKLEVVWTVIPTFIALSMFWVGWSSYAGLRNVPENALEIETIAQMYDWVFRYPDGKETNNEIIVPKGRPVRLNITSDDVIHGLFIPAFRIKVDAVPKVHTYAWFYPEKIGTFTVQCTEFCGIGHADMTAELKVVSEDEYNEWIKSDK
ncbi:MAG: cytochrome c oxidase subunit II [Desulfamplus sp.]|nr:cytochrome c oxidase subunit II [Desulfamplus sp.]